MYQNTTLQTALYKKLRERVDAFPQSRCDLVSECINLIKPGSRNIFVDVRITPVISYMTWHHLTLILGENLSI